VIPPEADAAFVAAMEDVLAIYARPVDPLRPLVCFDEAGKELTAHTRPPRPARPGHPAREDSEYARGGATNLFLACAPHLGWRQIAVTARRTGIDFAHALRALVDEQFPDAERITLVLDNLNTHRPAALYQAFPPAEARRILERIDWHFTPTHGSWLTSPNWSGRCCGGSVWIGASPIRPRWRPRWPPGSRRAIRPAPPSPGASPSIRHARGWPMSILSPHPTPVP